MKLPFILLCLLVSIGAARAQQFELDTDKLAAVIDAANEWALENLDTNVLRSLGEVDRDRVEKFLDTFEHSLRGSNVLDLASLRVAATNIIPILENYEETAPYAAWLQSRLDYFTVAEELKRTTPKPPATKSNLPPAKLETPSPAVERKVWVKQMSDRPLPPGADKLVPKLKPIFSAERVPPELVWIAEVESSFNSDARSPVGAAGLFQLMPTTAKQYGLRRWPFDQRYQPEPSARAAARYLGALHKRFGDWPLAIAAYNAGEGRVQSLLEKHKAQSFDQIATRLPAETQMFVPKVEAALLRREGVKLAQLKRPAGG